MTERCFQRCIAGLARHGLSREEVRSEPGGGEPGGRAAPPLTRPPLFPQEACLDGCAGKLVRSSHRLMAAYVQLMPSIVQRRTADCETPGPEGTPGSVAAGPGPGSA